MEQNTIKDTKYYTAVRYLVIKKMTGQTDFLLALKDYMEGKMRLAEAPDRYNISKRKFRTDAKSYAMRARNSITAQVVAIRAIPIILRIVPTIMENPHNYESETRICKLCGRLLFKNTAYHTINKHMLEVEEYTEKVISTIKNNAKKAS